MTRSTPQATIVGAGFLIFLVFAVIYPGLEHVPSHHFGEVILPGKQVLAVVPRSKVPDEAARTATPAKRLGRTGAVQLSALREYGLKGSLDGSVQRRCISGENQINPVRGPGKCEIIGRGTANRGGQFRDGHLAWLVPRIAKR